MSSNIPVQDVADAALAAHLDGALRGGIQARLDFLALADTQRRLMQAARVLIDAVAAGRTTFFFGNGGSAADAQHLAAEFVCRLVGDRCALPAIALTTDTSAITAIGNDYGFDRVFSRQIHALAKPGDVAIGISTSGNSVNVINGINAARSRGVYTIALTGGSGGQLINLADLTLNVPSPTTAYVQETHIAIGHALCGCVDMSIRRDGKPSPV